MLSFNLSKIVTMNHAILHKLLSHKKKTAKTAATLVLILSSFILQAQNIDANWKTMNKIIILFSAMGHPIFSICGGK